MAQNEEFDWSPNIPFKIYEKDYVGFMHRLVKVLGKNTQTRFIERGVDNTKYVNIMLETEIDDRTLEVHMRHDNLYVDALGRKGEEYTIFKFDGVKNFGQGSKDLGYGESYTSITRHLDDSIYELNYSNFVQAVETLIDDMSTKNLNKLITKKWMRRIFTVITAIAEGARNKVVSVSYNDSIISGEPTTTPWMWIQLMYNNWESFSKAAIGFDENIGLTDLTKDENDMLFARNVPHTAKDLKKNLKAVLARGKICRAALNILCGHKKVATLQASSSSFCLSCNNDHIYWLPKVIVVSPNIQAFISKLAFEQIVQHIVNPKGLSTVGATGVAGSFFFSVTFFSVQCLRLAIAVFSTTFIS
ncbi:hypothetical protein Tco_0389834 [Tanacetum coccineum]